MIRNRIQGHRRVRAGDLLPHELNPRLHSDFQKAALAALYAEIGFARSLLAYELPDGRLKLIDGHLRQAVNPDMIVDVEVLDVNDAEARALLLSLDPLAQLADYDGRLLDDLKAQTATQSEVIGNLWATVLATNEEVKKTLDRAGRSPSEGEPLPEQYLLIVFCDGEQEQIALLERFRAEGLRCEAKIG